MNWLLAIWEVVLFVVVVVWAVLAWRTGRAWAIVPAFLGIWLLTAQFYGPVTFFQDRNNGGQHWWTDPWNPWFHWLPFFHWWMWALLFATIVAGLLLERNIRKGRPAGIAGTLTRGFGGVLLVLALIGIDWTDPFYAAFPQHNEVSKKPAATKSFLDLVREYDGIYESQQQLVNHGIIPDEPVCKQHKKNVDPEICNRNLSHELDGIRTQLANTGKLCHADPTTVTASFTYKADMDDQLVAFDASGSTGLDLEYSWHTGDPNEADPQVKSVSTFVWPYSLPSTNQLVDGYKPVLTVTNRYQCKAHYPDEQHPLVITVPAKATAAAPSTSTPTSSPNPPATPKPASCSASWTFKSGNHAHYRFVGNGIAGILHAKTDKAARAAATKWLWLIRTDKANLSGAALAILQDDFAPSDFDTGRCANANAVDVYQRIKLVLANAFITVGKAPASLYNDGVEENQFGHAAKPGLRGNRTALKVVTEDGRDIWILGRSGNPLVNGLLQTGVVKTD